MKLAPVNIEQALRDELLLGAALGQSPTWDTWVAVLRAAFGLPLDAGQAEVFEKVAGGREPPTARVRELWCIIGRRSGKSRVAALLASYLSAFGDYRSKLSPGEAGVVLVLAASKSQAKAVHGYIRAFFEESPILSQLLDDEPTQEEIRLKGNIVIAVHTNSYRTVRGRTLIAAVFDEVGFWRDENSSQPDLETYRAVLPALATTGGMLIGISSPYAQRGLLFDKHQQAYGKNNADVLVVQAGTAVFNPTIDTGIIEQAHIADPESAKAEWEAQFRGDLSNYIDRQVVEACVEKAVHERGYIRDFYYVAFCDPSSGQHDSMTLGIAHREGTRAVLDCLREVKAPFSPTDVVNEFLPVLKSYQITSVKGDRYAVGWVTEAFEKTGIRYVPSDLNRSEVYLNALPMMMSRQVSLLDSPRLVTQISQLERRTQRSGRDAVDHMRGAADDLANAALGAIVHVPQEDEARRTYNYGPPPQIRVSDPLEAFR